MPDGDVLKLEVQYAIDSDRMSVELLQAIKRVVDG
jgi:hypothetical protein